MIMQFGGWFSVDPFEPGCRQFHPGIGKKMCPVQITSVAERRSVYICVSILSVCTKKTKTKQTNKQRKEQTNKQTNKRTGSTNKQTSKQTGNTFFFYCSLRNRAKSTSIFFFTKSSDCSHKQRNLSSGLFVRINNAIFGKENKYLVR